MPLGWATLANTQLSTVALINPNSFQVIRAWGGGCYDSLRSCMYLNGGGHGDYSGNEIYRVNFTGTPSVQRLTPNTNPSSCSTYTCDGGLTPNAVHSYRGIVYLPNIDRMFRFAGAPSGTGFGEGGAWLWNPNNVVAPNYGWTLLTQLRGDGAGGISQPQYFVNLVCYNSNDGLVYVWDQRSTFTWNPTNTANPWVVRYYNENGFGGIPYQGCIDTLRNRMYFPTDAAAGFYYLDLSLANGVDNRRNPGAASGNNAWFTSDGAAAGMDYDPLSDRIVISPRGSSTVYLYNPATNSTTLATYAGGPTYVQTNGNYGRFAWATNLSCFVFVNDFTVDAQTLTLDTTTPDVIAPTDPASLALTVISSSQINLGWTASTDLVGPVTYEVERCTGTSCSGFSIISNSVTVNSYSDSGLTAGTVYRYRVRAHDGALNYSNYCTPAEATTTAADIQAPTDPSNLVVTPISYSQLNQSWTASTDNVGVASYRVERCTGSACTNFAQVGAPTSNSFSDTGLAASTVYRYRVKAIDAALNESGYTSIVSGTTSASGVLQVGSTKPYTTLAAAIAVAVNGDRIEVDPEVFQDDTCTVTQTAIDIIGIGPGRSHFKWGTGDWTTNTANIPNGQGIIKFLGSGTIENLEFSGAKVVDENGAGIRYNGGSLAITDCYFHDSENGILGQSGASGPTLTIEHCVFERNGKEDSAGFLDHNVYIGKMSQLIFRFNRSVNSHIGHTFKSRADYSEVTYNHFSTKASDGSYEVEFPNGGVVYFVGNVIEQGAATDNSTIFSYGAEGLINNLDGKHHVYANNNTFYDWRGAATIFQFANTPQVAKIVNNSYGGVSGGGITFRVGTATALTESNNLLLADTAWVDVANANFHSVLGSSAINGGISPGISADGAAFSLTPIYEYVSPANKTFRQTVDQLDVGAYEFGTNTANIPRIAMAIRG